MLKLILFLFAAALFVSITGFADEAVEADHLKREIASTRPSADREPSSDITAEFGNTMANLLQESTGRSNHKKVGEQPTHPTFESMPVYPLRQQ